MSNYYDENELIRRIQKGDESALAIIISEYHAYVGKIVYSILGSYSHKIDLQGVVNQIFFTLWHKANKIDPSKSVTIKGYLGTLARNTAINEKKKCIPDYQINDEVIADISDDFNQVELRLLLANALRKLNKDEQLILVLFYFQNEKIADISRITGIPASTVKSKLKRCKEKMKKFLEEMNFYESGNSILKGNFEVKENNLNISGGEAQKLALYKLYLDNKPICVLDEPTAALDSNSEEKMIEFIKNHFKEKTVIIITHKPQILKICNRIIKLELHEGGKMTV